MSVPFRSLACAGLLIGALSVAGCHRYDDNDGRAGAVSRTTTTEQVTPSVAPAPMVVAPGTTTTTTTTRQTTIPQ
jgi:hypothetical protein